MKKEVEALTVRVPQQTRELLDKAREAAPVKLPLGTMVATLVHEKYGHLAGEESNASKVASRVFVQFAGDKAKAESAVRKLAVPEDFKEQVVTFIKAM